MKRLTAQKGSTFGFQDGSNWWWKPAAADYQRLARYSAMLTDSFYRLDCVFHALDNREWELCFQVCNTFVQQLQQRSSRCVMCSIEMWLLFFCAPPSVVSKILTSCKFKHTRWEISFTIQKNVFVGCAVQARTFLTWVELCCYKTSREIRRRPDF